MTSFRDPIGIHCPTHGLQAGRTICKWCHYDPLASLQCPPGAGLPRTFTGDAAFYSEQIPNKVSGDVCVRHDQKILIQTDPTTHYYGVGAGSD